MSIESSQTYTLANDIDLGSAILNKADIWGTDNSSGSGFISIGTNAAFTGTLNGNGHLVDGLYIKWDQNTASPSAIPTFITIQSAGSLVQDMGLTNVNITA